MGPRIAASMGRGVIYRALVIPALLVVSWTLIGVSHAQCVPSDDATTPCSFAPGQPVVGTVPPQGAHLWTLVAPGDGVVHFTATLSWADDSMCMGRTAELVGQITAATRGAIRSRHPHRRVTSSTCSSTTPRAALRCTPYRRAGPVRAPQIAGSPGHRRPGPRPLQRPPARCQHVGP